MLSREERSRRVREMVKSIGAEAGIESLIREPMPSFSGGLESMPYSDDAELEASHRAVEKVAMERDDLGDEELFALEAIVLPRERPVVFIQNGTYGTLPAPWTHYAQTDIRQQLTKAIPMIGRIELPDSPWIPYGGTGFVVGKNLLMTNRHVAELFAEGLGRQNLVFRAGQSAAVNFRRERGEDDSDNRLTLRVRQIVMIHPFWDMALLNVDGLPANAAPLRLSVTPPEALDGRDIAVIGYPARDDRNDLQLQDRIFERTYNVKRLHPGKIKPREAINSFGNRVSAVTHDSSTLGGNSGSAVVDARCGEVLGLHFAGIYLRANYAVPTYELARDPRVVDAGVNFVGRVQSTADWDSAWRTVEAPASSRPAAGRPAADSAPAPTITTPAVTSAVRDQSVVLTLPLQIKIGISLGTGEAATTVGATVAATPTAGVEALRPPVVFGELETRTGYAPEFLELEDDEIALPSLTATGLRAVAKLEDDSYELKYHKFSVVMHKKRRLALFTAANVDWRKASHEIDGRKPSRRELTGLGDNDFEQWVTDERLPDAWQLPDLFYTKDGGAFDKGHLVRRDDVCWGTTFEDIQMSNGDTYHTTNCSPQVASFNQSARGTDNWGDLENLVQQETKAERAVIFSGPVLDAGDPVFVGRDRRGEVRIQIPRKFWKIIVVSGTTGPQAYGFTLEQDLTAVTTEFVVPERWKRFLKPIREIERLLFRLAKLTQLKPYDQYDVVQGQEFARSIR